MGKRNKVKTKLKYPKLLSEEMLLITPAGYDRLVKQYTERDLMRLERLKELGMLEAEDSEFELTDDGVAIIQIAGPIGHRLDAWDRYFGAVDVKDIEEELEAAEAEADVILLDIDSPGGMVTGTPELADRIRACSKPVYAFTEGMMASAAYWIGCATERVFATKSSDVGSIGVYIPFLDISKMLEEAGIEVQMFTSGKYKGMGMPGTSLTRDQAKLLQDRVMGTAEMFFEHVEETRGEVKRDAMQGQVFRAEAALEEGLIDQVVEGRDEVIERIAPKERRGA